MEYYITKYDLTKGIYKTEGEITETEYLNVDSSFAFFGKGDYFETEKEAIADARNRRDKKIYSLKKQLTKMQGKKFILASLKDVLTKG